METSRLKMIEAVLDASDKFDGLNKDQFDSICANIDNKLRDCFFVKHANPILDDLWRVMGGLYDARHRISDSASVKSGEVEFDHDTFNEIVDLQTRLQRVLTRLENEAKAKNAQA